MCLFGPTGSGKTLFVVEPALLEWPGLAVVTTVKSGVLEHTEGHRSTIRPVFTDDPTGSTGRPCSTWTPLIGCADWTGASQMAGWLVAAAGTAGGGEHDRFWTPLARKLLAPLLFATPAHAQDRLPAAVRGAREARGPGSTGPGAGRPHSRPRPAADARPGGNTAPLRDLPSIASTGREHGITDLEPTLPPSL